MYILLTSPPIFTPIIQVRKSTARCTTISSTHAQWPTFSLLSARVPLEVPLPLAPRLQDVHLASVEVTKLKNNRTQTTRAVPRVLACPRRPSGCGPPPHNHSRRAICAKLGAAPPVSKSISWYCCAVALLSPGRNSYRARYSTVTNGPHNQCTIDSEPSLPLQKSEWLGCRNHDFGWDTSEGLLFNLLR